MVKRGIDWFLCHGLTFRSFTCLTACVDLSSQYAGSIQGLTRPAWNASKFQSSIMFHDSPRISQNTSPFSNDFKAYGCPKASARRTALIPVQVSCSAPPGSPITTALRYVTRPQNTEVGYLGIAFDHYIT